MLAAAQAETDVQPAAIRVLIVEDNADDAALLQHCMRAVVPPIDADVAATGTAALVRLASCAWDAIIMDYHLPDMDGGELMQRIRSQAPDLPLIVVSGHLDDEGAVLAMRNGVRDFFRKDRLSRLPLAIRREVDQSAALRAQRQAEAALAENNRLLAGVLDAVSDVVWSLALPERRFLFVSSMAEKLFGHPPRAFIADPLLWLQQVHPEDRELMRSYALAVTTGSSASIDYRVVLADGEVRWLHDRSHLVRDDSGQPVRVEGISSDITERKRQEEQLYRASHLDDLTGLPNRSLLADRLAHALARAGRTGGQVGVLLIDLDRFKEVNSSLGHQAGDAILVEAARRLVACVRAEDSVARLGGDEFIVLLSDIASEHTVERVAQKIQRALAPPMSIDHHTIHCTASLGLALYPRDGDNVADLLKNADTAMYRAKHAGRDTFRFYAAAMNAESSRRLALENALRGAIGRGELEVHYQPQIDLARGGAICGFEALARWRHPQYGMVPPAEFIPIAEESGLIEPIGDWILREACRTARRWVVEHDAGLRIAVNLSARQFAAADLPARIDATLRDTGLPARNLELEITESLVMADADISSATLAEFKRMGVSLAIDDFGTGYSSLAYLRRLPIDHVKIDRSFVSDIASNPDAAAICASIIAMSHALRLQVVAEGVETEAQAGFLLKCQCERLQGYLYGKPMPQPEADAALRAGRMPILPAAAAGSEPGRTLLLLDDEESILSSLKRLLRREGYAILATTDPDEAFALLATHRVGVVISDQRMPRITGTDFLRAVKGLYPGTVRMVLSGYTELQSIVDAINEGSIFRFLTKPWEDDALRSVIREAFVQQEMSSEIVRLNRVNEEAAGRLGQLNQQLEMLLSEKASRIDRNEAFLAVMVEMLHSVPMPLVAVDDAGMLVLANSAAQRLWPGAQPGANLSACLPAAATSLLDAPGSDGCAGRPDESHRGRLCRRRIEVQGGSGWLISLETPPPGLQPGDAAQ